MRDASEKHTARKNLVNFVTKSEKSQELAKIMTNITFFVKYKGQKSRKDTRDRTAKGHIIQRVA